MHQVRLPRKVFHGKLCRVEKGQSRVFNRLNSSRKAGEVRDAVMKVFRGKL